MIKKLAIVYITHDGFTSLYTGVGTVARDFLLSFPEVSKKINNDNHRSVDLYAVTIKYNCNCFGYSEDIKNITNKLTKYNDNIHLIEIPNGSDGSISYGTIKNWNYASISAATFIYSLSKLKKYDKILVVCVDTPFTNVANYYFNQYQFSNIDFVWLPQSTVLIHKYDSAIGKQSKNDIYIKERYNWEKNVVELSNTNKHVKIGFIGNFMKNHLIKDYQAKNSSLISLKNGLYFDRLTSYKIDQDKISKILKRMDVPIDRPLLFSFGRAEPYKGLDLVIKNSISIIKRNNYFVLILASPYSMDDPYVSILNQSIKQNKNNIKVIFGLDFLTPHYIMQWKNTKILALLSRAEPLGMIPAESRFYNNKNLTLLTSNVDGFKEQINDGVDGYKTDLNDKDITSKLELIAKLDCKKKETISTNGYNKVIQESNQININYSFIRKYLN